MFALQELGFEEEQSKMLLDKFTTVQAVVTSAEAKSKSQLQYHICPHGGSTALRSTSNIRAAVDPDLSPKMNYQTLYEYKVTSVG